MKTHNVSPRQAEGVPADGSSTGVLWKEMLSWDTEGLQF